MPSTGDKAPSWVAIASGGFYVMAFLVMTSVLLKHPGFPLDDSWIHQTIARNLVQTHALGFPAGHWTPGSTSLLWSLVLSLGFSVLPSHPALFSAVLNAAFLFGIGFTYCRLVEEDGIRGRASWCLILAPAISGNILWFGLIGMEHLLFIFFSLCLVRRTMSPAMDFPRNRFLVVALPALLVLTRPEGLALVLLLIFVMRGRHQQRRRDLAVGAVLGGGIAAAVNWRCSGKLTPQTMQGRQFLAGVHGLSGRLVFAGQSLARVLKTWDTGFSGQKLGDRSLFLTACLVTLLVFLLVMAFVRVARLRATRLLVLCCWALIIEILYFVVLPNTGHGGRYISFTLMMCLSLLGYALHLSLDFLLRDRLISSLTLGLLATVSAVISISTWRTVAADGIDQINTEHAAMADWLVAHLPEGSFASSQIAAFDIGRIGYQVHGNLVDLGGLVDPAYMPFVLAGQTPDYLRQRDVGWIVLPTDIRTGDTFFTHALSLEPTHGLVLTEVHRACADAAIAQKVMQATAAAFTCQTLYRATYTGAAYASGDHNSR